MIVFFFATPLFNGGFSEKKMFETELIGRFYQRRILEVFCPISTVIIKKRDVGSSKYDLIIYNVDIDGLNVLLNRYTGCPTKHDSW